MLLWIWCTNISLRPCFQFFGIYPRSKITGPYDNSTQCLLPPKFLMRYLQKIFLRISCKWGVVHAAFKIFSVFRKFDYTVFLSWFLWVHFSWSSLSFCMYIIMSHQIWNIFSHLLSSNILLAPFFISSSGTSTVYMFIYLMVHTTLDSVHFSSCFFIPRTHKFPLFYLQGLSHFCLLRSVSETH